MEEITFEELVEEIHYDITDSFRKDDILKLLKQVREATIEECKESIIELHRGMFREIYNKDLFKIKTDRIKIK